MSQSWFTRLNCKFSEYERRSEKDTIASACILRSQACLCSIYLKLKNERFEIPVTDFCDRVRRLARGTTPSLSLFFFFFFYFCAPSSRRPILASRRPHRGSFAVSVVTI